MDEDSDYMTRHGLATILECFLTNVVPPKHPHPEEVIAQAYGLVARLSPYDLDTTLKTLLSQVDELRRDPQRFQSTVQSLKSLDFNVFEFQKNPTTTTSTTPSSATTATVSIGSSSRHQCCYGETSLELLSHVFVMFESLHLLERCEIDAVVFCRWLLTVRHNYHASNPFHNFLHAFNVLQTLFVFLHANDELWHQKEEEGDVTDAAATKKETALSQRHSIFTEAELLAMCLAALCHDLQHPGVNNAFLVTTGHPLAMRYNDLSVLEQHHASTAFAILEMGDAPMRMQSSTRGGAGGGKPCDITASLFRPKGGSLCSISPSAAVIDVRLRQQFRALVLRLILATDVTKHHEHIAALRRAFSGRSQDGETTKEAHRRWLHERFVAPTAPNDPSPRAALMTALILAADISNEVRSFEFSRRWAPLVCEEFCQQGDVMAASGFWLRPAADPSSSSRHSNSSGAVVLEGVDAIPPMFRRDIAHPTTDQPGFIRFLCLPLYEALSETLPWFATRVEQLKDNANRWTAKY